MARLSSLQSRCSSLRVNGSARLPSRMSSAITRSEVRSWSNSSSAMRHMLGAHRDALGRDECGASLFNAVESGGEIAEGSLL